MSAQLFDSDEFIPILDYQFLGNDVTVENKRIFITHLRQCSTIYVAANRTGINKLTAYRWRDSDPVFSEAWDDALEDSADIMETSTYEDALGSQDKAGNPLLKMFWLKAHRSKFRDKVTIDIPALRDEIRERLQAMGSSDQPPAHFQPQHAISQKSAVDSSDQD